MNCDSAQHDILLDQAGELSTAKSHELQKHLMECPACRRYKISTDSVVDLARHALPNSGPSPESRERIMAAARRHAAGRPTLFFNYFTTSRFLAAAAGFIIVAAVSCLLVGTHRQNDTALRVSEMSTIVAMVTEEGTVAIETTSHGSTQPDLRVLARQILRVEGLLVEEVVEEEEITPDEDAPPRDLQSHSTFDSQPAECA
ncbi:MAG: zf-HC2 domain-containing protein [bacterium]